MPRSRLLGGLCVEHLLSRQDDVLILSLIIGRLRHLSSWRRVARRTSLSSSALCCWHYCPHQCNQPAPPPATRRAGRRRFFSNFRCSCISTILFFPPYVLVRRKAGVDDGFTPRHIPVPAFDADCGHSMSGIFIFAFFFMGMFLLLICLYLFFGRCLSGDGRCRPR